MELIKAKQILELNIKEAGGKMPPDTFIALKLAVTAIDRLLFARSYNDPHTLHLLPGED